MSFSSLPKRTVKWIYLPDKRAGSVLFAFTPPFSAPKAVRGCEGLRLHDLGVVHITGNPPASMRSLACVLDPAYLSISKACLKFSTKYSSRRLSNPSALLWLFMIRD